MRARLATLHWLSTRIQARIQTVAALDLDIGGRQTMARLEATTWEIEGERFARGQPRCGLPHTI